MEAESRPIGYVEDCMDCGDHWALAHPVASEASADGMDNDCDGSADCEDADCAGAAACVAAAPTTEPDALGPGLSIGEAPGPGGSTATGPGPGLGVFCLLCCAGGCIHFDG